MSAHPALHDLSAFMEGDIAAHEHTRVEQHLASCPQCRRELRVMQAMVEQARSAVPEWSERDASWISLAPRLAPRSGGIEIGRKPNRRRIRRFALATVAAGVVTVLVTSYADVDSPAPVPASLILRAEQTDTDSGVAHAMASLQGLPRARDIIANADREISAGIADLRRELSRNPSDPVLIQLLGRAIQHKARLAMEVTS